MDLALNIGLSVTLKKPETLTSKLERALQTILRKRLIERLLGEHSIFHRFNNTYRWLFLYGKLR